MSFLPHISWLDFVGPVLASVAFWYTGRGISNKAPDRKIALRVAGLLAAVLFIRILDWEGPLDALAELARDLGIGMFIGSFAISRLRSHPLILAAPGVILVGLYALFIVFFGAASLVANIINSDGETVGDTKLASKQILLELGADDRIEELEETFSRYNARAERAFATVANADDSELSRYFLVNTPNGETAELLKTLLADRENVDFAAMNDLISLEKPLASQPENANSTVAEVNDPMAGQQWGLAAIDAFAAIDILKKTQPRKKARVAIIDTGVDGEHADVKPVFGASPGKTDRHGHGTHCSGIAGAVANNNLGIASLNWEGRFIEIVGYKGLNDDGSGTQESISEAIIRATKEGADVISLSLGGYAPKPPKAEVDAIKFALKKGVIVLVAAGNDDDDAKDYAPANIPGVIVVSAVGRDLKKASFSNTNASVALPIAAPGVDILSLKPGSAYVSMSGTSMATPLAAGLAGVLKSLKPELKSKDLYKILKETGKTSPDDNKVGKVINAKAAIEAVL